MFIGINLKPNGLFNIQGFTGEQIVAWFSHHDVSEVDNHGDTLLHVATRARNRIVVEFLLN